MKNKIELIAGRQLKFCNGCEKCVQCQECIATQCMADDVEAYMKSKCNENSNQSGEKTKYLIERFTILG